MLQEFPVRARNRHDLVGYLCELHNNVNRRLNKTEFNCKQAFDIWGGDCGCEIKGGD